MLEYLWQQIYECKLVDNRKRLHTAHSQDRVCAASLFAIRTRRRSCRDMRMSRCALSESRSGGVYKLGSYPTPGFQQGWLRGKGVKFVSYPTPGLR